MNRRILLLLPFLLLGIVLSAAGQSRDDGSVYSRFGLGELRSFSSSKIQAMGGGGTAMWSLNYVHFDNPATMSRQVLVRAIAGVRLDGIRSTDANNNIKNLRAGSLNAVQFSMPLKRNILGLGLSFEPFSRTNYQVVTRGMLRTGTTPADTTSYQINHEGTGGLQTIRLGLGYRPFRWLSLGGGGDFIFGITEESRHTSFTSQEFVPTTLTSSTRMVGMTGRAGVILSFTGVLTEEDDISVAARLRFPISLQTSRAQTLGESLNRDTLGTEVNGTVRLPTSTRAGIAYYLNNRWTFAADILYEPWTQFESDLPLPGYDPPTVNNLQNRTRYSGGVEFLPAGTNFQESYFSRMAYRVGFYYDEAYVTPTQGSTLSMRAITGGLSLPALLSGTRLDLNFELGLRESGDQRLIRDRFVTISVTLNVGERWFIKRRLR